MRTEETKELQPIGSANAPFVYFDGAIAYGSMAGEVQVELGARALIPIGDGQVRSDLVVTAHLRCNWAAAVGLREALDKALRLAEVADKRPAAGDQLLDGLSSFAPN